MARRSPAWSSSASSTGCPWPCCCWCRWPSCLRPATCWSWACWPPAAFWPLRRCWPSSPGYVGTFDGVLINVLHDAAGIAAGQAAAYDVVVHATLFLPVVLVGTLVLWRSHVTFDQITHASAPVAELSPPPAPVSTRP